MVIWFGAIFGLLILAGGLLLRRGRRGRVIGDHPLWRRCRFDPTGLPCDAEKCPECGGDIATPAGRVVGNRHPVRGVKALGAILLLLGLCGLGYAGF